MLTAKTLEIEVLITNMFTLTLDIWKNPCRQQLQNDLTP